MNDMKPNNPNAFPQYFRVGDDGMTLRDYFAAAALTGSVMEEDRADQIGADGRTYAEIQAHRAYKYADAMLLEREKEQ